MIKTMLKFKFDKKRKYIIIIGAVLLLLGLIYRLFPFFQGIQSASAENVLKEKQLAKYRQMVHEGKNLEARLISLNRTLTRAESGLLTGKTPPLAAVDIQNILNKIASRSDVEMKTVRVLKPEKLDEKNYLSVPVQFSISSTIRQLKEILYRIETSPKYLTVKKVRINVARRGSSRQIRSDITVAGVMKKAEN